MLSIRWVSTLILAAVLFHGAAAHSGEAFLAGFAELDITPPVGYRMAGYFVERTSLGTHDPLLAKVMYLQQGSNRCVLVLCDLIGIPRDVADAVRARVATELKLDPSTVLIGATHSHTGPNYSGVLRDEFHRLRMHAAGRDDCEPIDYKAALIENIAKVIRAAIDRAAPVSLHAGFAEQQGLSFNRRFHMKNGTVQFKPRKAQSKHRPRGRAHRSAGWHGCRPRRARLHGGPVYPRSPCTWTPLAEGSVVPTTRFIYRAI